MNTDDSRFGTFPWAIHPWPQEDESIVSWLHRFSQAQEIPARALLIFLIGQSWKELLGQPYLPFLPLFTTVSGVPLARLEQMLLPPGVDRHSHELIGGVVFQHCPLCLAADAVPYYRLSWLSPDAFLCLKHHTPLQTQCPVCQQLQELQIFKHAVFVQDDFRGCPACQRPFEEANNGFLPALHGAVWLQRELQHRDRQGFALLPSGRRIQRRLLPWFVQAVKCGLSEDRSSYVEPTPVEHTLPTTIGPGLITQPHQGSRLFALLALGELLMWPAKRAQLTLDAVLPDEEETPPFPRPFSWQALNARGVPYTSKRSHHWNQYQRDRSWFLLVMLLLLLGDEDLPEISSATLAHFDFPWAAQLFRATLGKSPSNFDSMLRDLQATQRRLFSISSS